MKKTFILIFTILLVLTIYAVTTVTNNKAKKNAIQKQNKEYEYYLNKQVYGTEVATLINKAVEQNKQNNIPKDEKGNFIDDGEKTIKIYLKMKTIEKTYSMETIYNSDITKFVQNFNLVEFKCTSIEYHKKTGRVSKLIFEEQE